MPFGGVDVMESGLLGGSDGSRGLGIVMPVFGCAREVRGTNGSSSGGPGGGNGRGFGRAGDGTAATARDEVRLEAAGGWVSVAAACLPRLDSAVSVRWMLSPAAASLAAAASAARCCWRSRVSLSRCSRPSGSVRAKLARVGDAYDERRALVNLGLSLGASRALSCSWS